MTYSEFSKRAMVYAAEKGCASCELFYANGESFEVNANGGEIDRYSVSREAGVSVRVSLGGHEGYAYTEAIGEPERLVDHAMDNAACIDSEDEHPMQTKQAYRAITREDSALKNRSESERIALAKQLEELCFQQDPRVKRVVYCTVEYGAGSVVMENSLGLCAEKSSNSSVIYVMPSVQEGEEVQTGFAFRMGRDATDAEGCAKEAVEDALSKLGGSPVDSGCYRVLLKPYAMCDLLAAFAPMFSADEAQKGCSLLAGKEGQSIANERVTLWDDPFDPVAPRAFDGEGTPCETKAVIQRGELKTLLHNLKTAKKAGVQSTGNASRRSAASTVGIAPSVFRLECGDSTYDTLLAELKDGLVIAELEGLHAGVDAVSGDFSLKASGFLVENGAIVRPVSNITVAGNFVALLKNVFALGSDIRYSLPHGGCFASPSVLVNELTVAGC
ncbi:MAG: metallopeptidase TldD-related protein [Christensenella sp.]|nr:metallopeptidase TldD-related protein [Christensenella sp.]